MFRFLVLASLSGCAFGSMQTVTLGPSFGDHSGVVVALELSAVAHERFASVPASADALQLQDHHGPHNYLGIAVTATSGALMQPTGGVTGFATAGIDYLPFLYEHGSVIGFGAHVGIARGHHDGAFALAPRLWFAIPVSRLAGARLLVGVMLRCQLRLDTASGCGPQLVITRAAL